MKTLRETGGPRRGAARFTAVGLPGQGLPAIIRFIGYVPAKETVSEESDTVNAPERIFKVPMTTNSLMTRDVRGNFRRDLGWEIYKTDKYRQHRFYLGRDEDAASLRSDRLQRVWEAVEGIWKNWIYVGSSPRPLWDDATLTIAMSVSRGETEVVIDTPPWICDYLKSILTYHSCKRGGRLEFLRFGQPGRVTSEQMDTVIARYYADLRTRLPFLKIAATDPRREVRARKRLEAEADSRVKHGRSKRGPALSLGLELGLASGTGLIDLEFADDGLRLGSYEDSARTIPWAVIGGVLAKALYIDSTPDE